MRFDVKCRDCVFFKGKAPPVTDCANIDGKIWDPEQRACDNFVKGKKKAD
ncbi:MAG: hypothetical protein NTU57_05675 [Candidatus Aenigmarchaeota archaeon]|nr:hypothetical protein [Candidatus Aenigmarchaeota archaeon]